VKDSRSWADVSSHFRACFPDERPTDWRLIYVKFSNKLSQKGDVKRSVKMRLESLIPDLDRYRWRVPLPWPGQKELHDLIVEDGSGQILHHDVEFSENPNCAVITISFPPLPQGHKTTMIITYLLELVAKPHRHFLKVIMMQATWKKATNILI